MPGMWFTRKSFSKNGERKLLFEKDTTRFWYVNAMLHSVAYRNGKITYDTAGHIAERIFD